MRNLYCLFPYISGFLHLLTVFFFAKSLNMLIKKVYSRQKPQVYLGIVIFYKFQVVFLISFSSFFSVCKMYIRRKLTTLLQRAGGRGGGGAIIIFEQNYQRSWTTSPQNTDFFILPQNHNNLQVFINCLNFPLIHILCMKHSLNDINN